MSKRNNNKLQFGQTVSGTKIHIVNNDLIWFPQDTYCGIIVTYPRRSDYRLDIDNPQLCKTCLKAARIKGVV